jgi:hypothetical protein
MGTYPSFSFTPDDKAIIIWASGQIWRVPLTLNEDSERISGGNPQRIPFKAKIEKRLAETMKAEIDLLQIQTAPTQQVNALRDLSIDETGSRIAFEAAGITYVQDLAGDSKPIPIPRLHPRTTYYSPSFIPHLPDLVIHAKWSNRNFTAFEISNVTSGKFYELTGLPFGRYAAPTICECTGSSRRIAFVRTAGDTLTGATVAISNPGLWVGDLRLPSPEDETREIEVTGLKFITSEAVESAFGEPAPPKMRFFEGGKKLLIQMTQRAFVIDFSDQKDGKPIIHELAKGRMSMELAAAPRKSGLAMESIAFIDFGQVYLAPGDAVKPEVPVWTKPGNATKGVARVSVDGGHDIIFSGDGKKLFWLLGRSIDPRINHLLIISQDPTSILLRFLPCRNVAPRGSKMSYRSPIAQISNRVTRRLIYLIHLKSQGCKATWRRVERNLMWWSIQTQPYSL